MFLTTLSLALSALRRNRTRSLLTMLGIIIGVAAVVMMQSMGRGATAYVGEAISGLGSNMLVVIPGAVRGMQQSSLGAPLFTFDDLEAVRRQAHDVAHISATGNTIKRIVVGASHRSSIVAGVQPAYFTIRRWGTASGRLLGEADERQAANVCVIGQTIADALYPGQSPLARELRVQHTTCRVVGVMAAKGAAFGSDQDDAVFMPYSTFSRKVVGNERIPALLLTATSQDQIDAAQRQVIDILRRRRHVLPGEEDNFAVRDPREMQTVLQSVTGMLTSVLAGVAAISLLVGGIGIMNIMLVSVSERTREIGVRLAIGARASDILMQFLVEASALSTVGGALGLALGLLGSFVIAHSIHVPFVAPSAAMALAFTVSVAVGVVFGVVPARKAARLNPLAALRHE